MPMFVTSYRLPSGSLIPTQCFAEDHDHLDHLIALRGMGERPGPPDKSYGFPPVPRMASSLMAEGRIAAANHAMIWTGMIAVRAGVTDAWGLLNDEGIVHETAHLLETTANGGPFSYGLESEPRHVRLARRIEAFERLVPGVHPCWGGEPGSVVPERQTDHGAMMVTFNKGDRVLARLMADLRPPVKPGPGSLAFAMDAVAAGKAARARMINAALKDRPTFTPTEADLKGDVYPVTLEIAPFDTKRYALEVLVGGRVVPTITTTFVDPGA